jgi:tetratricopeptide (TPR) repeat protein
MTAHAQALLSAVAHQRAARLGEAETMYRAILAESPDEPRALHLFGLLRLGAGQPAAAAALLERAARARPGHAGICLALARAQLNAGAPAAALAVADAVLAGDAASAEAHFLRGTACNALGRSADAVASLSLAVALAPSMAAAHLNLANAWVDLDELSRAEAACRVALALDPGLAEAHASLGFILASLGRLAAAIGACEAAIGLRPDFAQAHWNLATAALLSGDFARGFQEYEWRKRHDDFRRAFLDLPGPVWRGEKLDGRTILVLAEQGLGDTIQLARYLPWIARRGGVPGDGQGDVMVRLMCAPPLVPLLEGLPGVEMIVPRDAKLPEYDVWIDQMSLPRAFGTRPETIPHADGYLSADPVRVAAWRARLPGGRKVGVVWAGNPGHSNDRRRSLPYPMLERLLAAGGVDFVSLQCGARAAEAALLGLTDWSAALTDYRETAALVANLDLVVAVDTSVAHLAGALGRPVWVMLPFAPDWRWIAGRDDTPWYAGMRLFRQTVPGGWDGVVARIAAALAAWRDAGS